MEGIKLWLWLTLKRGISSSKISSLLEKFDSVEDIYNAEEADFLQIPKISGKDILALSDKSLKEAEKVFDECGEKDITILTFDSAFYPLKLKDIYDPPYVLYVKSQEKLNLNEQVCITIVGTREPTDYGAFVTEKLSKELAIEGFTIVSGMARGIDAIANRAALSVSGKTVAVLGCGVDVTYPSENIKLMEDICAKGIVLSEFPPGFPPLKENFPQRNRILSALSVATVVTEAPLKSGALITASIAMEQNKDVYAVPGNITRKESEGSNILIARFGAKMALDAKTISDEFSVAYQDVLKKKKHLIKEEKESKEEIYLYNEKYKSLSETEKKILKAMSSVPMHIDIIMEKTGISADELSGIMIMLEILGMIKSYPGMMFSLSI